jgi:hypothetical protein
MSEIKEGYDRVTDCIGCFSGLDKIDPVILRNAADRGTTVHAIIDKLIESPSFFYYGEMEKLVAAYARNQEHAEKEITLIQNMLQSFERWADGKKFEPKPERFYHHGAMVTGEIDTIVNDNEKKILIDFKTPISESKTWPLQASAYKLLGSYCECEFDELQFIQLCRKGGIAKTYTYEPQIALFLCCVDVYRYFYKDKKFDMEIDYI